MIAITLAGLRFSVGEVPFFDIGFGLALELEPLPLLSFFLLIFGQGMKDPCICLSRVAREGGFNCRSIEIRDDVFFLKNKGIPFH